MTEIWFVPAIGSYRRKKGGVGPEGPKRPRKYPPTDWKEGEGNMRLLVPVEAETMEEAEKIALESEYVDHLRPNDRTRKLRILGRES